MIDNMLDALPLTSGEGAQVVVLCAVDSHPATIARKCNRAPCAINFARSGKIMSPHRQSETLRNSASLLKSKEHR
jgi:hypothetical protein